MDPARQHAPTTWRCSPTSASPSSCKVANVPATTGYGEPVQSLLNFKDGERVIAATLVDPPNGTAAEEGSRRTLAGATAGGMGFFCRPDLSETTKSGRRIARTKEGDEILVVASADGDTSPRPPPRARC